MTRNGIALLVAGVCVGVLVGAVATISLTTDSEFKEPMKMEFGIRISKENGLSVFGLDEIQKRLEQGGVVTALQCKGANFQKTGKDGEKTRGYFSGGTFEIEFSGEAGRKLGED